MADRRDRAERPARRLGARRRVAVPAAAAPVSALFVDTGAFYALADADDDHHAAARGFLRRLGRDRRPLVTSTYVVDVAITLIRMHVGHAPAVAFGRGLHATRWCRIVDVDEGTRAAAFELFARYDDQRVSFTDCTSFALMRAMALDEAFTFDRTDFLAAGFRVLP